MTNQSGKVARGLRTIGANIVNLAQTSKEFEITVNGATKTIQLWNETGTDMLDTYDVLKQIAEVWDDMSNAEKSSLAITLAKKTQMDTFLAVLGNFESAENAYVTALNSEGSAWKENTAYMESVEAHQAKLKAEWEKLVLSQPIKDFENALLSAGTTLLKFVNSDVGQLIIKIVTLTSVMALLNTALTAFNTLAASSSAGTLLNSIYLLITGETTLTAVTETLTTAMLSNPLFWGAAVITGVVLLVNGLKKLSHAYEEQVDKLRQVSDEYEQQTNTVNNLEEQLQKVQSQIEQLEKKKLEITDDKQLKNLQDQSNELKTQEANLKNQLVLEKAKTEELERQAKLELNKSLNKSQKVTTYDFNEGENYNANAVHFSAEHTETTKGLKGFETQLQGYENLKNKLREVEQEYINLANAESQDAEAIDENKELQDELKATMEDLQSEMYDNLSVAQQMVELNHEDSDAAQDLINRYDNLVNAEESVNSTTKTTLDEINDLVESAEDGADSTEKFANAWDEAADSLQTIQDAYDTMAKAVKEYNENQGYSAETLAKLNELSPEYLAALVNENGQLSVNVDLLKSEYEAQKQASIEKINMARYTAIAQLCEQQLATATQGATQAIEEGGNKALEKSNDYNTLAGAASRAAAAMSAVENGGFDTAEFQQKLNEINTMFDNMVHNVENSSLQLASTGSKSAGSHKDAWVEAFKEEKDALDNLKETEQITEYEYYERLKDLNEKYFGEISGNHKKYLKEYRENEEEVYKGLKGVYNQVKDYLKEAVEHGYEKAINALKKEEKKVLAEIKKQIEAIKKEKEEVIKGIDKQIKALKKEKEAVEKYYNDQIDAIKRENEVLQEQNELLEKQQELQKAKQQKVMVMQQGRFQLTENESAVAQAEQNLSNYEDQLSYEQQIQQLEDLRDATVESIEERIEALEEYKEFMEEYYDEQIEAMEEYYDQVQEEYEKQIEALQEQLDAFKEGYQKEEDLENARLAAQVLGMNERKDLYEEELSNLKDYINEVNAMLALLGEPGAVVDYSYSPKTGYHTGISEVAGVDMSISSRASGDSNFAKDEMALVGESPNAELVLGSRLNRSVNSGELVHLSKGSGVVNAESTQTLAGLLNGLSTPTNVANNRSTQQNFTFGNISLPNVTDANSFVNTLSNKFNNYAIQYGNTRK